MIISDLINLGSQTLKKNKIASHLLDSEVIMSRLLNESREKILTYSERKTTKDNVLKFKALIKRRLKNEPVAYILNEKEFWNEKFFVDQRSLIPRPETELLVEQIIKLYKDKSLFFLEAGTGSGCIILSLLNEIKKSRGIGIDISKNALNVTKKNSKVLNLKNRLKLFNRSVDQIYGYKFDLIVSNPPYICTHEIKNLSDDVKKYEPIIALDGGNDGLDVIKKVIYKSKTILKKKGMLALEIGYGQFKKVSKILKLQGFKNKYLIKDYHNNIRCILTELD